MAPKPGSSFRRMVWFAVLFCVLAGSSLGQSQETPVWSLDVARAAPASLAGSSFERAIAFTFLDPQTLLLGYDVSPARGDAGTRAGTAGILMDVASGTVRKVQAWNTVSAVFATAQGNVMLIDGSWNKLGESKLTLESQAGTARSTATGSSLWWMSADRRTFATLAGARPDLEVRFLDAETLKEVGDRVKVGNNGPYSVFGNEVVLRPDGTPPLTLWLADSRGRRELYTTDCRDDFPQFIDHDHVLLFGCGRILLLDRKGDVVYRDQVASASDTLQLAGVARNGSRFAVTVTRNDWREPPISIAGAKVLVYDTSSAKPVFDFDSPQWDAHQSPISSTWALSPDGSHLASFRRGVVSLYALP